MGLKVWGYLPTAGTAKRAIDHASTATKAAKGLGHGALRGGTTWRPATIDSMRELARRQEAAGAHALLVPIAPACEDPWLIASSLIPATSGVKFLLALRPTLTTPVLFAQQVASFQRLSGGRLLLNVTPGLPGPASTKYGDFYDKAERLAVTAEFLEVVRGVWSEEPFDYEGRYYRVEAGSVGVPDPVPTIYYGGSSELSMQFAARYADVYLSFVEPLDMVVERFARVRRLAAEHGRQIRMALSFGVITRDTAEEAWAEADARLEGVSDADIAKARELFASSGITASGSRQRLMSRVVDDRRDAAVIAPNLWVGTMMVRYGTPPVIVGSHEEVADRIEELMAAGCDDMGLLDGSDEDLHVVEGLFPVLRARGLLD